MRITSAILGVLIAIGLGTTAAAEIPVALMPKAVAGPGLNVTHLEAQRAWYQEKLGMRVINTIMRDGKPHEYVMGYDPSGAIVALLEAPQRPPGPNRMGRVILEVPDAKGLADYLKGQGVEGREVVPSVAYFITDPEGNPIELYTPPPR